MKINWLKIFLIIFFSLLAFYIIKFLDTVHTLEELILALFGLLLLYCCFQDDGNELRQKLERARKSDQAKQAYLNRK